MPLFAHPDRPNHYLKRKRDLQVQIAYHTDCIDHPEEDAWAQEALGDDTPPESTLDHHYNERAKLRGILHRINQELGA